MDSQKLGHRRLSFFVEAVAIAIITVTHLQSANAFCGTGANNEHIYIGLRNHCLQLKSSNRDSISTAAQERIERIHRRRIRNLEHWGVEHHLESPTFPSTFDEVADEASRAIAGTICGLQRPDPNVASNAMHESVLDYRPTQPTWASKRRWVNGDDSNSDDTAKKMRKDGPARMGIEIDGVAYLSEQPYDEGRAMRMLALRIAQRLSASPWDDIDNSSGCRPVAIYFSTMEQSLLASRELSRLKEEEDSLGQEALDHIYILCLGQDSLPPSMVKQKVVRDGGKKDNHQTQSTSSYESMVLIVKPTDYDASTIQANVVDKLQSLLFQASASSIPAVVISPRLSELPPLQQSASETYKRTGPSGFEQSGFQKSSTYGGIEPPVGPTSWLLRDLVPPVYVWVGCSMAIGRRSRSNRSLKSISASFHQQQQQGEIDHDDSSINYHSGNGGSFTYFSRMALTQSAMESGHHWHIYAVKERLKSAQSNPRLSRKRHKAEHVERELSYHYLGSSNASMGRPSSRIMNDVFEEFCEQNSPPGGY